MYTRLTDVLEGHEDNYLLPFYWQHGNHTERIPEQVKRIYDSGCRALCLESRPHPDFCGEGWWRDVDIIMEQAKKLGMKVWVLDDDRFPTGHANGGIEKKHMMKIFFWAYMRTADIPETMKNAFTRV